MAVNFHFLYSGLEYTPGTPEQQAAHDRALLCVHGGTGWAAHLLDSGQIGRDEYVVLLAEMRASRRLRSARERLKDKPRVARALRREASR
jgi:MOSC domain-containing protein YiiM